MASLTPGLRGVLERAVLAARDEAEKAALTALKTLAVDRTEPFATQTKQQRQLRNALRARTRQLGGGNQAAGFRLLVEEVAYEQWHLMLFARFLAENSLLMHPSGIAVTLEDCAELAPEEGETNRWQLAARYAGRMLPGIFRTDDPSVQLLLTPEGREGLERILAEIPSAVFTSDDGLGWVYQFWQSKKKKEVSSSGRKIERLDLAAYSQLFTEDYMVRFLLENSLGAWWAARHPDSPMLKEFQYLRFRSDGIPAAGTFPGWPERAAEVTMIDPCCGSGHFLVAAFEMLRRMRMEEEGLGEARAADAVLHDNLFGLEIDPRCVQIAAFSLALAAWKAGGYRLLPLPNIACSGIPVGGQLAEWTKLAGDDVNLKNTLDRLYHLFSSAPDLGSLINPVSVPVRERMFEPDFAKVAAALERALTKERTEDPVAVVFGEAARGVARAASFLSRRYTLVATNVPYLVSGKQGETLKEFLELRHSEAKSDLATAFIERCLHFCAPGGSYALVSPHAWLFLGSYKRFREGMLQRQTWAFVARLGPRAFETITGHVVNVSMTIGTRTSPGAQSIFAGLDVAAKQDPTDKAKALQLQGLSFPDQADQLHNPDSRIDLGSSEARRGTLLGDFADVLQGAGTTDNPRYLFRMWEVASLSPNWEFLQVAPDGAFYSGCNSILRWEGGRGPLASIGTARKGEKALHKRGVSVAVTRNLNVAAFLGTRFDSTLAAVVPKQDRDLLPITAYMLSKEFPNDVRRLDQGLSVTESSFAKVHFDLDRWQKLAKELYPNGLPEAYSNDPTQWLFKGDPADSTAPLQVAVARLLGYRWPQQDADRFSALVEQDSILPLSPVAGKEPAAERLRGVLSVAYGEAWSPQLQERLLQEVGYSGKGLEAWLRDGFFDQHCKLFHHRPFVWHVWDGRRDGFSALVNYHKLDAAGLGKLIYTYLGDWIRTQRAASEAGTPGADGRLVAALELHKKLEAIRDGEKPYDIYVRWKPLHQQSIGWNPDLNNGVRLNIRPFVMAGVLRTRVNVNWKKDRGLNPDGSERINDVHLTVAQKRAAREATVL